MRRLSQQKNMSDTHLRLLIALLEEAELHTTTFHYVVADILDRL